MLRSKTTLYLLPRRPGIVEQWCNQSTNDSISQWPRSLTHERALAESIMFWNYYSMIASWKGAADRYPDLVLFVGVNHHEIAVGEDRKGNSFEFCLVQFPRRPHEVHESLVSFLCLRRPGLGTMLLYGGNGGGGCVNGVG